LHDELDAFEHGAMPLPALRIVGAADDHLFHLVELVNAIETCRFLAGRTRLASKAGAHRAVAQGKSGGIDDLVGMQSHEPDFSGAGQKEIVSRAALALLEVVGLLAAEGEEPGADHALLAHDDGHTHRGEAAAIDHEIEGVSKHRLMQAHAHAREHIVARAGHLHAALEVGKAEIAHELDMRLRSESAVVDEGVRRIE